jgi:microsomal dipeptidase-like Zn-dependent dipeptidase
MGKPRSAGDAHSTDTVAEIARVTRLARRGHPARRIERILGGNLARPYRDVWPA